MRWCVLELLYALVRLGALPGADADEAAAGVVGTLVPRDPTAGAAKGLLKGLAMLSKGKTLFLDARYFAQSFVAPTRQESSDSAAWQASF